MKTIFVLTTIILFSSLTWAQDKKNSATPKQTSQKEAARNNTRPRATGIKNEDKKISKEKETTVGTPGQNQERESTPGNGLAPQDGKNVKGSGKGSGPGSDAGVGLSPGFSSSTSSSGSPAVPIEGTGMDGTNTKQQATFNMAGSPVPSNSDRVVKKERSASSAKEKTSGEKKDKTVEKNNVKKSSAKTSMNGKKKQG